MAKRVPDREDTGRAPPPWSSVDLARAELERTEAGARLWDLVSLPGFGFFGAGDNPGAFRAQLAAVESILPKLRSVALVARRRIARVPPVHRESAELAEALSLGRLEEAIEETIAAAQENRAQIAILIPRLPKGMKRPQNAANAIRWLADHGREPFAEALQPAHLALAAIAGGLEPPCTCETDWTDGRLVAWKKRWERSREHVARDTT